jgi:hypothetical protein
MFRSLPQDPLARQAKGLNTRASCVSREVINMARGRPAKCPYCGGSSINKGFRKTKTMGQRRIKLCKACRRKFTPKNQSVTESQAESVAHAEETAPTAASPVESATSNESPNHAVEGPEPILSALDQEWTS